MRGTTWLVCDVSGSMLEAGKRFVIRTLVREVEQYFRLGYATEKDIKLLAWNNELEVLPWSPGDEVPTNLLQCCGSADIEALLTFFHNHPDDKFIVLSDGFWADDSQAALTRWKSQGNRDALRILKVGADANLRLKGSEVFKAEDLFAALDGWLGK